MKHVKKDRAKDHAKDHDKDHAKDHDKTTTVTKTTVRGNGKKIQSGKHQGPKSSEQAQVRHPATSYDYVMLHTLQNGDLCSKKLSYAVDSAQRVQGRYVAVVHKADGAIVMTTLKDVDNDNLKDTYDMLRSNSPDKCV